MPDRDQHRHGISTASQYTSDTKSLPFIKHPHIGQAALIERIKINSPIPSNPASRPRQKSPLSVCYTLNDEDRSNLKDNTDLLTERHDSFKTCTIEYMDKNQLAAPLDITSASTSHQHLQSYAYHGNNTRERKHLAAGKSPGISTNNNSSGSPDKNNKNNTSDHNTIVTHALFDNAVGLNGEGAANTPSRKIEQNRQTTGSNRLSWIQYMDKKQPIWIRGFFDKHQRVNDEMTARTNKLLFLSTKSATSKTFTTRLASSLPFQLTTYLPCKLSIPSLKMTDNKDTNHSSRSRRRYAKDKKKHSRKTTNKKPHPHPPSAAPKGADDDYGDAMINEEQQQQQQQQQQRQPLLESGVYRMSHRKLTNPRRSLREQVIIINSMFRYLSTLPMKQYQHHHNHHHQRFLHHFTSPPNQTITNTSSSLKTPSILPHLKRNTLTTSSTTS